MTWKKDADARATENFGDWRETGAKKNEKTGERRQGVRREKEEGKNKTSLALYASPMWMV